MVSNPTIQYILYEWLTTKMVSMKRLASSPSSQRLKLQVSVHRGSTLMMSAVSFPNVIRWSPHMKSDCEE
eukprot:1157218-Pelagomonas_calceolata.AAC.2